MAGRLGPAEGSTTLKFYAQFTRPADERAAAVIPSQLDGLRKKQRLRELYDQRQPAARSDSLAALAVVIGPQAGLDEGYRPGVARRVLGGQVAALRPASPSVQLEAPAACGRTSCKRVVTPRRT